MSFLYFWVVNIFHVTCSNLVLSVVQSKQDHSIGGYVPGRFEWWIRHGAPNRDRPWNISRGRKRVLQVATGHVVPGETGTDSSKTGTVPGNTGTRPKTLFMSPLPRATDSIGAVNKSDGEDCHQRKKCCSSSSSLSSRSPWGHWRHHCRREDPTSALLLQGFCELTASIRSLIPKPTAPAQPVAPPEPRQVLPDLRTGDVMSITVVVSFSNPGSRVSATVAVPNTKQSSGN